jgi:PiT family inorganic phosphate transporter
MLSALHHTPLFLMLIIGIGLAFDFTNGFHDTANAVATVIATRVLPPRVAILMSAILNFCGAFVSVKVANTIAKGLVESHAATQEVILAALVGAIVWNLATWYLGIPNSSSHALIGGLVGATLMFAGPHSVIWHGVFYKVIFPMVTFPFIGGLISYLVMMGLFALFANSSPSRVSGLFTWAQRLSAAAVSFNHGQNDAQKTMGIITLALVTFHLLPPTHKVGIPTWVIFACATAMGLGTLAGGWRIIKTLGLRITRLEPINGFAAEMSASVVLFTASQLGMPVSTTHIVSGSIFGVGFAKRAAGVRWGYALRMATAWALTLPAAALVAAGSFPAIAFSTGSPILAWMR